MNSICCSRDYRKELQSKLTKSSYIQIRLSLLYSSSFRRTTTIVRQWSYADNFSNFNSVPCTVLIADSRPFPDPLHKPLPFSGQDRMPLLHNPGQPSELHKECSSLEPLIPILPCRRPCNNLAFAVCQRNDDIVE